MPSHEIRLVCLSRDLADTRSMNRVIAWHIDFTVLAELVVGATDRGDGSKGGRPRASTGRGSLIRASSSPQSGFNPRAHAGRDRCIAGAGRARGGVSIHAPTRGATRGDERLEALGGVSIHAPTRGATPCPTWNGVSL